MIGIAAAERCHAKDLVKADIVGVAGKPRPYVLYQAAKLLFNKNFLVGAPDIAYERLKEAQQTGRTCSLHT